MSHVFVCTDVGGVDHTLAIAEAAREYVAAEAHRSACVARVGSAILARDHYDLRIDRRRAESDRLQGAVMDAARERDEANAAVRQAWAALNAAVDAERADLERGEADHG